MRPHRWQPTSLPRPWDSPGKNTGVGCHFLLQCVKVKLLSRVRLLATPCTAAYQAPPSMGFSRQEYWSGVPVPSPEPGLGTPKSSFQLIFLVLMLEYVLSVSNNPKKPQIKLPYTIKKFYLFHNLSPESSFWGWFSSQMISEAQAVNVISLCYSPSAGSSSAWWQNGCRSAEHHIQTSTVYFL